MAPRTPAKQPAKQQVERKGTSCLLCAKDGDEVPAVTRGLCRRHYMQFHRAKETGKITDKAAVRKKLALPKGKGGRPVTPVWKG